MGLFDIVGSAIWPRGERGLAPARRPDRARHSPFARSAPAPKSRLQGDVTPERVGDVAGFEIDQALEGAFAPDSGIGAGPRDHPPGAVGAIDGGCRWRT